MLIFYCRKSSIDVFFHVVNRDNYFNIKGKEISEH
jgi:hypothetical protein